MRNSIQYEDWLNDLTDLLEHDRMFEPPETAFKEAAALGSRLRLCKLKEKHPRTQSLFEHAIDGARLSMEDSRHLSACVECKEFVTMCRRLQQYVKSRRSDKVA